MAEIVDSYSESNQNSFYTLGISDRTATGQCFEVSADKLLDACRFYLSKANTPTGTMVARVYALTGTFGTDGKPTGSALASSDAVNVSVLTLSFALITFNFSGADRIYLTSGEKYCVLIDYPGADRVKVGIDSTSPTHNGNSFLYNGSYTTSVLVGVCFYVDGVTTDLSIDTNDQINITENVSVDLISFVLNINVSDQVDITESIGIEIPDALKIDSLSSTPKYTGVKIE